MSALFFSAVVVVTVAAIVWLNIATRGRWSPHHAREAVTLQSGETVSGLVMRKKIDGSWRYRKPTVEERENDEWWSAIR